MAKMRPNSGGFKPAIAKNLGSSAIARGLTMPLHERRERWQSMFEHLQKHDITAWRKSFLAALNQV